jgi:ABC-type multidrug transport system ATPase subunit
VSGHRGDGPRGGGSGDTSATGDVALGSNLTGGQAIDLLGRLRGGLDPVRRKDLLDRFEPDPAKKARAHSKGNRQKAVLVAAPASGAELLILDEPASGPDPLMEAVFTECVRTPARIRAGRTSPRRGRTPRRGTARCGWRR